MPLTKKFFNAVRQPIFNGLEQSEVDGCNAIGDEWGRRGWSDLRWLAYMMATAFHETAHTMQPVTEFGGKSYFNKYNAGTRIGRSLGNTQPGDGYRYRGRGYVQITGRANYAKMTKITGVDLVRQPERALEPAVAAQIMFDGMTMGTFTGRALKHYFTPTKADWVNARRIINGTDRAVLISGYAKKFYAALQDGGFEA